MKRQPQKCTRQSSRYLTSLVATKCPTHLPMLFINEVICKVVETGNQPASSHSGPQQAPRRAQDSEVLEVLDPGIGTSPLALRSERNISHTREWAVDGRFCQVNMPWGCVRTCQNPLSRARSFALGMLDALYRTN